MEQETVKLLNVLRRIARASGYVAWTKPGPDATQFLIAQYNRVLTRLTELEPAIKPLFTPLNETASPEVVRLAAKSYSLTSKLMSRSLFVDLVVGFILVVAHGAGESGACLCL